MPTQLPRGADRSLAPRVCVTCGAGFQPYRANHVTCSPRCARRQPHIQEAIKRRRQDEVAKARKNANRRMSYDDARRQVNRRINLARYGLTIEQFDAMAKAQGGVCAICGNAPSGKGIANVLHVDHDHDSGAVRGLLCTQCNIAIGLVRDDPIRLMDAAAYLLRLTDVLGAS